MRGVLASAGVLLLAGCGYVATPGEALKEGTEIARLAKSCAPVRYCGRIGYVDCGSAVDGPAYYFDRRSGRVAGYCGGYCMGGRCTNCPPPGWTCGRRTL